MALTSQKQELNAIVNHLAWLLETKLGSLEEHQEITGPSLQALTHFFKKNCPNFFFSIVL